MSAFDAKTRFGELLDRVAAGEEIVITRHDKPVARIVPEGRRSVEESRRIVATPAVRNRGSDLGVGERRVPLPPGGDLPPERVQPMDAFVADASAAIAWVRPAQTTPESNAWLRHVADRWA